MEGVVWREAASPWQVLEELDAADVELIQLGCRKPEDVRLVRVMPGLLDALSREKQILERLGASNATFRDYSGFRDFLQRLSEEQPPVLKAQAWETQCSNQQHLLLNSMKKTA